MKMSCESVQDVLPELASGRIGEADRPGVESHVAVCPDCRDTLAALRLLQAATPPAVPPGLESRIRAAVARRPFWRRPAPAWGLAAAAVLALLLGRSLVPGSRAEPEILAMGQEDVLVLLPDDGMVAGGPLLDDLTDDELATLLEELDR